MKKLLLIGLGIILVALGVFGWLKYESRNKFTHSTELFWRGRKALENNNDSDALKLLAAAAERLPENAEFNYWAGEAAKKLGKKDLAYSYYQQAWADKKKEPEVLLNLITTSPLPRLERSKYFRQLVAELEEEEARLELSALLEYQREDLNAAAALLEQLVTKYPRSSYAERYAEILLSLKQPERALATLEAIRLESRLTPAGYTLLGELYFALDKLEEAQQLFSEAEKNGLDTTAVRLAYGKNLFLYGQNDRAAAVLKGISIPKLFTSADIASAQIFREELQADTKLGALLGQATNPNLSQAVNNKNADRFADAEFTALAVNALNHFCQQRDWYTPELVPTTGDTPIPFKDSATADLSASENFQRNAAVLVAAFPQSLKQPDYSRNTHRARVILMMLDAAAQNRDGIANLLQLAAGSRRWLEGERYFGEYLLNTLSSSPDLEKAREDLNIAGELLNENNLIQLDIADALAKSGDFNSARLSFDRLSNSNIIIARSPLVQYMLCQALIGSGELEQAKDILISLFRRGYITDSSLRDLARISLELGDQQAIALILSRIQEYSGSRPSFFLLAAAILQAQGKSTAACAELDKLLHSAAPAELRANARLDKARLELQAKDFTAALATLAEADQTQPQTQILKAEILLNQGDTAGAIKLLSEVETLPVVGRKLYAQALAKDGQLEKAGVELQSLLNLEPDNPELLLNLALILNAQGELGQAQNRVEKVLDQNPNNIRANTLLAQLLLAQGKAADAANLAIKLLGISPGNRIALEILPCAYNAEKEYVKALKAADKTIELNGASTLILLQKAVALIELGKELQNTAPAPVSPAAAPPTESESAEAELDAEITALTADIHYTGALSGAIETITEAKARSRQDTATSEFLLGKKSSDLFTEALQILEQLESQPAARVLQLQAKLLLGKEAEVIQELETQDLAVNELFSFGVMAEELKAPAVAYAAYRQAYLLEPQNPFIQNNYANTLVLTRQPLTPQTRQTLRGIAENLPQALHGDSIAVNTAAMINNYVGDWSHTLELAEKYPKDFRLDPKLQSLLRDAQNAHKRTISTEPAPTKPLPKPVTEANSTTPNSTTPSAAPEEQQEE